MKFKYDWEGSFICPTCDERFEFARERADFPSGWTLQVGHVHEDGEEPYWKGVVYEARKGRRLPEIIKEVRGWAKP